MDNTNKNITLITTNAIGYPPFVFHKAIKFYGTDNHALVIHKTTSGAEILDYNAFMKGRHIIRKKVYPVRHPFNPEEIIKKDNEPFDWMNNNCEDFVSDIIEQTSGEHITPKSIQRTCWIATFAITLIILVILKQ